MKKNSKPPEERRRELIAVAMRLFSQRGYEAVSVRDILDEVKGAPGMFYYYFKSKRDIYLAAMEQFLNERLERKCALLEDPAVPFAQKRDAFRKLVSEDIYGYMERFPLPPDPSITDASYKLWDLMQMLNRLSVPYARFILQGVQEGCLSNDLGISAENAEQFALFTLYGAWGMIYNGRFTEAPHQYAPEDAEALVQRIYHPKGTP